MMEMKKHGEIVEVLSDELMIRNTSDALDVMGSVYYDGYDKMIVHQKNLAPEFFDLKTGIAGDILQKFSTYRVRLVIVGDFDNAEKKSLRDFIYESNQGRQINFVSTLDEALNRLG